MRVSEYGTIMSFNEIEYIFKTTIGEWCDYNGQWGFDLDDWEWLDKDPFKALKGAYERNGYTVNELWTDPDGGNIIINDKTYMFCTWDRYRFKLDENSVEGVVLYEFHDIME
jgi:hypothetical protein